MIIFPAIDIQAGRCVRLVRGDFSTAHTVASDPLETAVSFRAAGAEWIHMVDLDGARTGAPVNQEVFLTVARESGLNVELGGGLRDLATVERYLHAGISRCILGSAALRDPDLVRQAVAAFGDAVAVGIDAKNGMAAAQGWSEVSSVSYIELAKRMADIGVRVLIFTDIATDGTLAGPNTAQLSALAEAVPCDIIASGGIRDLSHIETLRDMRLYGAICGKSVYAGTLPLDRAIQSARTPEDGKNLCRFFTKSLLIPAVVQDADTGAVLMLAYMNRGALERTLATGETWFWSRSRGCYWHKGATSGHLQRVVSVAGDCDGDSLLVRVQPAGPACHTGSPSCFFDQIGG